MKIYLLPEDIKNMLLGYLMERPYKEVANGVVMLSGLKEYVEPVSALELVPPVSEQGK